MVIILLIVIILTSLVRCIPLRVLNTFRQPLTHQMISVRIRQLEELNDLTSHVYDDDATVGNSDYITLCPDNSTSRNTEDVILQPGYVNSGNPE